MPDSVEILITVILSILAFLVLYGLCMLMVLAIYG